MQIGDRVRHNINGFTGLVTGRTEYRNGCRQFLVEPEHLDEKGKRIDGLWTDEQNLEIVDAQVFRDPFAPIGVAAKSVRASVRATAGGPDRTERAT